MKNLYKNNKGFTIIEVLIVLAIAGLIMLVVFLAVPALQRNSRNTQRKADVSSTLVSVGEYVANNNGNLPNPSSAAQFSTKFTGTAPNLGYYKDLTKIKWTYVTAAAVPTVPTVGDFDSVYLANYAKCDATNAPTTTGASIRSVVALYNVEGSGGANVAQCVES